MPSVINASLSPLELILASATDGSLLLETAGITALSIDAAQAITIINSLDVPTLALPNRTTSLATTAYVQSAFSTLTNGFAVQFNTAGAEVGGYQYFPNGLILQWGLINLPNDGTIYSYNWPITFPVGLLNITCSYSAVNSSTGLPSGSIIGAVGGTGNASQVQLQSDGPGVSYWVYYIALGH